MHLERKTFFSFALIFPFYGALNSQALTPIREQTAIVNQ